MKLYRKQVEAGRLFLHEHPAHATSWRLPEVERVMKLNGARVVEADQCMFGLKTKGSSSKEWKAAKKPTKFMTNAWHIAEELSRKCDGSHEHQPLVSGRAHAAQVYPEGLCRAICRGL